MNSSSGFGHTFGACLILFCFFLILSSPAAEIAVPQVRVPDLQITLFASEPDIVTPIGLAVDEQNRLFVLESHTHQPKADYSGPKSDRVKIFADKNGNGKPDSISIFAEGLRWSMNLAFSPAHELYLSHRNGVVILHDRDHDGVSEARTTIVELQTEANYPHNGLDGLAFSPDGWLYFGLGENQGQAYTLKGTDGSQHSGGGEGGNIFRCRPDGSRLEHVATGFWNPFCLEFDASGHLFAGDNDPDGRPPCRLLHIIEHGDYGYKFRYGRSGYHPFVAWEGELPGTLPMLAGVGEAPSGVLECAKARLPARYQESLLVTSWGDDTIELYHLKRNGASFRGEKEVVVLGDKSFRPVAIVAGADGAIYITDWADQAYSVHGKGRIWRLSAKMEGAFALKSTPPPVRAADPADAKLLKLSRASSLEEYPELLAALAEVDPFIRSAAISALTRPVFAARLVQDVNHENPEVRVGALLALRRARFAKPENILKKALADPDENVRLIALIWIGEERLRALAGDLDQALVAGPLTPPIFKAYLATIDSLETPPEKMRVPKGSLGVQGVTGAAFVERVVRDVSKPPGLRALALTLAPNPDEPKVFEAISKLAFDSAADRNLRTEAVRTLAQSFTNRAPALLKEIAFNSANSSDLRAEAIAALAGKLSDDWTILAKLLDDSEPAVRIEAVRSLRTHLPDARVRETLRKKYKTMTNRPTDALLKEELRLALASGGALPAGEKDSKPKRPASDKEWLSALRDSGDAGSGRRLFFNPAISCSKCHRVQGRGGQIGPDLSTIARAADRDKLVQSILHPSRDIPPQFVQYLVRTKHGESHSGLLGSRGPDGALSLFMADGTTLTVAADEIASLHPSQVSLMPEGLEKSLTIQDFRDLLVFLLSLK